MSEHDWTREAIDSATASTQSPLWLNWSQIARTHLTLARRVREQFPNTLGHREQLEAMVVITAAAHALEGLSRVLRHELGITTSGKAPASGRILETIKSAFDIGQRQQVWAKELVWLFNLRGAAVHHTASPRTPVWSQRCGTHVAPEADAYSTEGAERAWALLKDVLRTAFDSPRPGTEAFVREHRGYLLRELDSWELVK